MSESPPSEKVIRFGVFEVNLKTAELRRQGVRIRLPHQSFQVLEALLLRPGELVTREELKQKLWHSDSFGDFEHGLNAAVNRVREALGDSSENSRFVETLPRRGYRFVAPVYSTESEPEPPQTRQPPSENVSLQPVQIIQQAKLHPSTWIARWGLTAAAVLVVVAASLFLINLRHRLDPPSGDPDARIRVVPLTTMPGREISPAFSPDGSQIAFAWDRSNGRSKNPFELFVRAIGSEKNDQLTHEPGAWIVPAWSPDGSTIAFARAGGSNEGIFSISARGGPERKLADTKFAKASWMSLSWSLDGQQLLYYTTEGLEILTIRNGQVRKFDTGSCHSPASAAFSPDGQWIAFTCEEADLFRLNLISLRNGQVQTVFKDGTDGPLAWANDSQRIVLAGLWEINIHGGEPRRLDFTLNQYAQQPAVLIHGHRLAYVALQSTPSIWSADIRTGLIRAEIAPSIMHQRNAQISPDGKKVAFESERSGSHEVWVANVDGSDALPLTDFRVQTGTPRWSHDGHWIAFDSMVSGNPGIYVVDPAAPRPWQIPTNGMPAIMPNWSADGKWIYFTSRSPKPGEYDAIYRVPAQGGIPERVGKAYGYNAQESKDGRELYFAGQDGNETRIYQLNLANGEQHLIEQMPAVSCANDWLVSTDGIYFVTWNPTPGIDFYDFHSWQVTHRISLDRRPYWWGGLSLSPDATWIAYSQVDEERSNLMLVEGFR